tara:strand:- start:1658 stop:1870 length:213 start_codon:yes stop_codon:yes gene_type:complete
MRTTSRALEIRCNKLSQLLNKEHELNYQNNYGGWQLTTNNQSTIIQHRISAKEMLSYLDGALMSAYALNK